MEVVVVVGFALHSLHIFKAQVDVFVSFPENLWKI